MNKILDDTDLDFVKWAVNELVAWKNTERLERVVKICGVKDKLMPPQKDQKTVLIQDGEHFMIVDQAEKISRIINQRLKTGEPQDSPF